MPRRPGEGRTQRPRKRSKEPDHQGLRRRNPVVGIMKTFDLDRPSGRVFRFIPRRTRARCDACWQSSWSGRLFRTGPARHGVSPDGRRYLGLTGSATSSRCPLYAEWPWLRQLRRCSTFTVLLGHRAPLPLPTFRRSTGSSGRYGVGLWRPGFTAPGYVYGCPPLGNSYRTFPVVYGTILTVDQIAPPPSIGVYAPSSGPSIGLYSR